jgi:enoyl-[acyl-carrier protein] reductase II
MIKTRLNLMLDIKYPIIQEGIEFVAGPRLAGAVSESGGLGVLASGNLEPAGLKEAIEKTREITRLPFGVTLSLDESNTDEMLQVIRDCKVPVVITRKGSPSLYTRGLKESGARVIHEISRLEQARESEKAGADAIIAKGAESGGFVNGELLASMIFIPSAYDQVKIPIIAAGGIVDGRTMAAALSLGAEGIQMGTRFIASWESDAHEKFKQFLIREGSTHTAVFVQDGSPVRILNNSFAERLLELLASGESPDEVGSQITRERMDQGMSRGDTQDGILMAGQGVGFIKSIKSAKDVIREIVFEIMVVKDQFSKYVHVTRMFEGN